MGIGSRIFFNQDGEVLFEYCEIQGGKSLRKEIPKISYIDLEYGEIDYSKYRIIGVNVATRKPILEEIIREKTQEEIIQELENQILLLEDEKVGGIL